MPAIGDRRVQRVTVIYFAGENPADARMRWIAMAEQRALKCGVRCSAKHFFIRAEMGKNAGRKQSEVDEDYGKAAHLAALVAPYRHPRLAAVKLAGNPVSAWDDATAEELKAEINRRLTVLQEAGILELKVIDAPEGQ